MMLNVPVPAIVTMQVNIYVTNCNTFTIDVKSNDTIYDVKLKIQAKEGILQDQQHLYYNGELENGRTLSDYTIENDKTIKLMLEKEYQELKHAMMSIK